MATKQENAAKVQLELQKLEMEVKALKRPVLLQLLNSGPLAAVIVALIGVISAAASGFFSNERKDLQQAVDGLKRQQSELSTSMARMAATAFDVASNGNNQFIRFSTSDICAINSMTNMFYSGVMPNNAGKITSILLDNEASNLDQLPDIGNVDVSKYTKQLRSISKELQWGRVGEIQKLSKSWRGIEFEFHYFSFNQVYSQITISADQLFNFDPSATTKISKDDVRLLCFNENENASSNSVGEARQRILTAQGNIKFATSVAMAVSQITASNLYYDLTGNELSDAQSDTAQSSR